MLTMAAKKFEPPVSKEFPTCFVCGYRNTGAFSLSFRQSGQPGPCFPFLETHEPPDESALPTADGKVLSCYACYAFLNQQWESYEKNKVPLIKRIYWLKRVDNGPYTGVEMGMQSEYASQVFGLTSDYPGIAECKTPNSPPLSFSKATFRSEEKSRTSDKSLEVLRLFQPSTPASIQEMQEEALDLSIDNCKRKAGPSDVGQPTKVLCKQENQEVLDLSMPDKNARTEVCYICGNRYIKGILVDIFAKCVSGIKPFFPSLMLHARPSGSRPMESSGKVLGCKKCYTILLCQWQAYEDQNVPLHQRTYYLTRPPLNNVLRSYFDHDAIVQSSTDGIHLSKSSSKLERKCEATSPLNMEEDNEESSKKVVSLMKQTATEFDIGIDSIVCCLCHQSFPISQLQTLSMVADKSNPSGMFFPFLKFLPQVSHNLITKDGRILVCKACHLHLSWQWAEYEDDNVPEDQRYFSLRTLSVTSQSPRLTPGSNNASVNSSSSTPTEVSSHSINVTSQISFSNGCHEHNFKAVKHPVDGYHGQPLKELEVVEATSESGSLTLAAITTQRALNININCYICGFYSKAGQTYAISSKLKGKELFFPFLTKHVSAYPEAVVDATTYLVCLICFHSLVLQWQHYEKNRIEYHARFYDTHNFTCFICKTKTFRKRLYLLSVKDYPFLKDHVQPPGGMVVNNGHSVIVCKDCYVTMNEQFIELERWGVPVEKRQYNWIQRPPPPELARTTVPIVSDQPKACTFQVLSTSDPNSFNFYKDSDLKDISVGPSAVKVEEKPSGKPVPHEDNPERETPGLGVVSCVEGSGCKDFVKEEGS